jgi:hypothetical protein
MLYLVQTLQEDDDIDLDTTFLTKPSFPAAECRVWQLFRAEGAGSRGFARKGSGAAQTE